MPPARDQTRKCLNFHVKQLLGELCWMERRPATTRLYSARAFRAAEPANSIALPSELLNSLTTKACR